MTREVFIIKNNTMGDIELKDFGIIISPDFNIELEDYDKVILSDELNGLLLSGDLIRIIDGKEVTDIGNVYNRPVTLEEGFGIIISGTTISVDSNILTGVTITNHSDLSGLLNDDHSQYLRTDGTRNLTGILSYASALTFTSNNQIVSKLYVDTGLNTKANQSDLTLQGVTNNGTTTTNPITLNSGYEFNETFFRVRGSMNSHLFEVRNLENDEKVIITSQNSTSLQRDTLKIVDFSAVGTGIGFGDDRSPTSTYVSINTLYTSTENILNFEWNGDTNWYKWMSLTGNFDTFNQNDMRVNLISQVNSERLVNYNSDLSPSYTNRSLVDKEYVDVNDSLKLNIAGDTMTGNLNIGADLRVLNGTDSVFFVDSSDRIAYINSEGLTGLVSGDGLSLFSSGRIASGDSVTMGRLRANAPGNVPRTLSLIDTNAVVRVWRWAGTGADPAVEFVWGTGETPADVNNSWWDMFLDGDTSPNDTFVIRRRTGGTTVNKLIVSDTQISIPMTTTSTSSTTGALIVSGGVGINQNLNVGGITNLPTLTVGTGLSKYLADYSASYDARTMVDKNYVDTLPLTTLSATSNGSTSTTSTTYTLQTGMQITNVPAGTYLVGYGNYLNHGSSGGRIYTEIYVGGTAQTGSEMRWTRGNQNIFQTHNYSNFVITLATTQTVEIRWRTSVGTATSTNRYLTLLKVSSIR